MTRARGTPAVRPRWRRWRARGAAAAAAMTVGWLAWLALLLHPQPLFAYSLRQANVVLYARKPLPPKAEAILREAVRRVSRAAVYDPAPTLNVFLCDQAWLFTLFAPTKRRVGGVADTALGGNVFIRPAAIASDHVIGFSGRETTGERTLAYFIAHELTHTLTARRLGRAAYVRLAPFQQEGYADYVGFSHQLDFHTARDEFLRGTPEMDTKQSGLYRRQELLVAYLLDRQGMTVEQLLRAPLDERAVERQLVADARF